ncbi:MAG: hypothetical protein ABFS34_01515 [Gemmatimonadota bacterium]
MNDTPTATVGGYAGHGYVTLYRRRRSARTHDGGPDYIDGRASAEGRVLVADLAARRLLHTRVQYEGEIRERGRETVRRTETLLVKTATPTDGGLILHLT